MGFFSFLQKKRRAPSFGGGSVEPLKLDLNLPPIESSKPFSTPDPEPFSMPSTPSFEPPQSFKESDTFKSDLATKDISRSIELLSSKLDTIKVMIENLNHRLDKIEGQKKETVRW